MARVIGRGKEDEIAGPQVIKGNRLPLPNLCSGCARQRVLVFLHFGFARFKCEDCGHEYLLAYGLKRS